MGKRIKRIAMLLAAVMLFSCVCACAGAEAETVRYEGEGFDTPEDAVLCYIAGLKYQDFGRMLSAFAWETQAEHYDFKALLTWTKGFDPLMIPGVPPVGGLALSVCTEWIRNAQITYIFKALEHYVNDEIYLSKTGSVIFREDGAFDEYAQRCDNGRLDRLAEIRGVRFYAPDDVTKGFFSHERNQATAAKMDARYGADETKTLFAAMDIGGESYAIAPTAARYGDKWYLVNMNSIITNIMGISVVQQGFFPVEGEMKEYMDKATPVSEAAALPEGTDFVVYEGEGFNTPEEAVACYFEGLKNGNIRQVLGTFAWETQAERYSLKEYALHVTALTQSSPVRMQFSNAMLKDMNLHSLYATQSSRICRAARCYLLAGATQFTELLQGYRIDLKEEADIEAFTLLFDNDRTEKLKGLGNIRLIDPGTVIPRYNSENVLKRMEYYKRLYGADEIRETIAVADLDGETAVIDPLLARYGDKWYIVSCTGDAFSILGVDANLQAFFTVRGTLDTLLEMAQ